MFIEVYKNIAENRTIYRKKNKFFASIKRVLIIIGLFLLFVFCF